MKPPKQVIPTIGLILAVAILYFEGGIWRILSFIAIGLGLFVGFAYWLFERAERNAKQKSN